MSDCLIDLNWIEFGLGLLKFDCYLCFFGSEKLLVKESPFAVRQFFR